jgi:hypothetical protein
MLPADSIQLTMITLAQDHQDASAVNGVGLHNGSEYAGYQRRHDTPEEEIERAVIKHLAKTEEGKERRKLEKEGIENAWRRVEYVINGVTLALYCALVAYYFGAYIYSG